MAIILDTDGFGGETYRGYLETALFTGLKVALPQYEWISTAPVAIPESGLTTHSAGLPVQKGLFHHKKTEKWLQQTQASAFISFKKALNTAHSLKQLLIIADEEQFINEKAIHQATGIGVVSFGLRQLFTQKYPELSGKSFLVPGIIKENGHLSKPLTDDIREIIAFGREYFILADFNCSEEKLTMLLKGFSAFKRMLHSSWKLMVIVRSEEAIQRTRIDQLLSNYKYREDVLVTDEELLPEKIRDAYALVSMDSSERLAIPIIEAAKAGTAVMTPATITLKHTYNDALAYIGNLNSEAVGDMLMKMYKDENFKQNLTRKLSGCQIPTLQEAIQAVTKELV